VRVEGQLVFSSVFQALDAALAGLGLGYVPEDLAEAHLARGRLRRALEDWSAPWSGYHLYYPHRRQSSPAFALLVDALRYRDNAPAVPNSAARLSLESESIGSASSSPRMTKRTIAPRHLLGKE